MLNMWASLYARLVRGLLPSLHPSGVLGHGPYTSHITHHTQAHFTAQRGELACVHMHVHVAPAARRRACAMLDSCVKETRFFPSPITRSAPAWSVESVL